jgi:antirestriction protein ArdC
MKGAGLSGYVAELGAALLGQRLGFTADHLEDHAAYLGSWLKVLRGDKRFLFSAGAHAQRAVDWMVEAAAQGGVSLDVPGPAGDAEETDPDTAAAA